MLRSSNIRVTHKIGALGAAGILGLLLVGAIRFVGSESQLRYQTIADRASEMQSAGKDLLIQLLELRRHEKDFLLRKNDQYIKSHAKSAVAAVGAFDLLSQKLAAMEQKQLVSDVAALRAGYDVYAKNFLKMAELQHDLGLTPSTGLEGALRTSVRQIEEELAAFKDSRLNELMLMMRRHEKDFMMRRDVQYRDQFKKAVDTFAKAVAASAIPAAEQDGIGKKLSAYQRDFLAYVDATQALVAKQVETSAAFAKIEPDIDALVRAVAKIQSDADAAAVTARDNTARLFLIASLAVLLGVSIFALFVGRGITKPLSRLVGILQRLAKGDDVEIAGIERRDEIGATARAVNGIKEMLADKARREAEDKAEQERLATAEREADIARTGEFLAAVGDIVAAGVAGDFTHRVDLEGKTGMLLDIGTALNSLCANIAQGAGRPRHHAQCAR